MITTMLLANKMFISPEGRIKTGTFGKQLLVLLSFNGVNWSISRVKGLALNHVLE